RYGLAASIWPRDQHPGVGTADGDVGRHDIAPEERVAGADKSRLARGLEPAVDLIRSRQIRFHPPAETNLGRQQVQLAQRHDGSKGLRLTVAEYGCEALQDAPNFAFLGQL